jgi:hypothetical protein
MESDDVLLNELIKNYESLEIENIDKLLLVGKKLLNIKSIVNKEDASSVDKKDDIKFENV